jgi:hypothetical protein
MYPNNKEAYVGSDDVRQAKPSTIIYIKRNKLRTQGLIDFHQKREKEMDKSSIRRSHGSR